MGGALLLVAVIYAIWATRLPLDTRSTVNPREWVGAIHVHTVASDGGGTLDEVAVAARDSGLDFLTITDHNVWAMPTAEYRAETLLGLGEEARVPAGHMLVLGGEDPALRITRRREAEEAGSPLGPSVSSGSGLRVVAHPEGPAQPWLEWDPAAFDAIEIWNWDTDLRDDGWRDWSKALLLLPTRPVSAMLELLDRPAATLSRWDDLLAEGHRIMGLCSVDAHSHVPIGDRFALPFPAYRELFRLARQHVLLSGDPGLKVMGLAPMAVAPLHQRKGIGSALVRAGLEQCKQLGVAAVVVLGHPDYYPRFGFSPAYQFDIDSEYEVPKEVFMAMELQPDALRGKTGRVKYHAGFSSV